MPQSEADSTGLCVLSYTETIHLIYIDITLWKKVLLQCPAAELKKIFLPPSEHHRAPSKTNLIDIILCSPPSQTQCDAVHRCVRQKQDSRNLRLRTRRTKLCNGLTSVRNYMSC